MTISVKSEVAFHVAESKMEAAIAKVEATNLARSNDAYMVQARSKVRSAIKGAFLSTLMIAASVGIVATAISRQLDPLAGIENIPTNTWIGSHSCWADNTPTPTGEVAWRPTPTPEDADLGL